MGSEETIALGEEGLALGQTTVGVEEGKEIASDWSPSEATTDETLGCG